MEPERRGEIKKAANKLEKWLANYLDGRRVVGSGNLDSWKGDVEWSEYLVDSKNTEKNSITLSMGDLTKIFKEGRQAARTGHLILTFVEKDSHWGVVPYVDCEFESYEQPVWAKASKKITISQLIGMTRKADKQDKIPSLLVTFERPRIGIPNKWLILPLEIYRKKFGEVNE